MKQLAEPAPRDDAVSVDVDPEPPQVRRRLGDTLVASGTLSRDDLAAALAKQAATRGSRRRLGQVVVDLGLCTEREVAKALALVLDLDFVDLTAEPLLPIVARLLPRAVSERLLVVPLDQERDNLRIACADPTNVLALDDIKLYADCSALSVVVATESQIRSQIARAWALSADPTDVATLIEDVDAAQAADGEVDAEAEAEEAPTVRLVSMILADAVRGRASDIHIEAQPDGTRVRYRVDGLLRDVMLISRGAGPALVSRIKILAGMDIAERRRPQDGRIQFTVDERPLDARVSTLPSTLGEKVVVRLLSLAGSVPSLDHLGLDEVQEAILRNALKAPQGLILITGPTGSGKTNTLYSCVDIVATPDKNLVTVEDPVEVRFPGITQVQINERAGLTFAGVLRSVLRQDPDVILVGEIRDAETAELALKAALTGHLVLSTLHANSAAAALTRLTDMGVEPFLVASSLTCVVAQRLVRLPCPECARDYHPDAAALAALGLPPTAIDGATPRRGTGCASCGQTGYQGRTGVFEVLEVDEALRAVLLANPTETAVTAASRTAGMTTLRSSALSKAHSGTTTFQEAARVTFADRATGHRCPTCERQVEVAMVMCPWCSTDLDPGLCHDCGHPLDPSWHVCPWCRTVRQDSSDDPVKATG
jgi:type IV pilus assembly protein PilB